MGKSRTILLTAGGSPGQEAIYRKLQQSYNLLFADMNISRISPTIPQNAKLLTGWADQDGHHEHLAKLCQKHNVDLLVPGIDEELLSVLGHKDMFGDTKIYLPKQSFVKDILDKLTMSQCLQSIDVAVPYFYLPSHSDKHDIFPIILKPRKGRGSRNVMRIESHHELKHIIQAYKCLDDDWIIQQCKIGTEFTV